MKIRGEVKCASCPEILFRKLGVYRGKPRCFVCQREQGRARARKAYFKRKANEKKEKTPKIHLR